GEKFGGAPLRRGQVPLAIAEDDGWLVAGDEVFELREHVVADVARLVRQPKWVVPLVKRIVATHAQTLPPDGIGKVAEQIALRSDFDRIPGPPPGGRSLIAGPQGEPFVMFRGQHNVLR